jgi:hypothetical protein
MRTLPGAAGECEGSRTSLSGSVLGHDARPARRGSGTGLPLQAGTAHVKPAIGSSARATGPGRVLSRSGSTSVLGEEQQRADPDDRAARSE